MPVPFWLEREAEQAVEMCPALALRLEQAAPDARPELPAPRAGSQPVKGVLLS
jgi:hypothetical protein